MGKEKLWGIFCMVLGAAFVCLVFIGNGKLGSLKTKQANNQKTIAELNAKLENMKKKAGYTPPVELTETEQAVVSHSAAELGDRVADLQNTYASLNAAADRESFNANVSALDACFTDSSKAARVPWYTGNQPRNWVFVTDGEFEGANKSVLWLCRNPENGNLLAYATAVYDSEADLFGEVNFQMTVLGNQTTDASGEPDPGINTEEVNQMAEAIQNADVPEERELTEEEMAGVWEAREQAMREQQAAEGGE